MSSWDELQVGVTFETPSRTVTPADADAMVAVGGYTHPLFADPAFAAASTFGRRPLPGQAVLLVMGGLIEQSERFDDTVIALVGFDAVRFRAPAFEGDELRVRVDVIDREPRDGKGVLVMDWTALRAENVIASARARMLFRIG